MTEAVKKRRGIPPGILKEEPYFPEKVLKIIEMKDSGMRLKDIAKAVGMTSPGTHSLIKRWGEWARANRSN